VCDFAENMKQEGHFFMGVIEITFMHVPRGQKQVASEP
jgi:hypothetical protein